MSALADGVHKLSEAAYFGHSALSASGAKRLLEVSPARWRLEQAAPPRHSPAFDLGRAAHMLVLRDREAFEIVDAEDWRTKAAREARDGARAEGLVPLLAHQFDQVAAMAAALRRHPWAFEAFSRGAPEQTLLWTDAETGVRRRAKLDWLPDQGRIFADYKTAADISEDALQKAIFDHDHYMRAAWYLDGIRALKLAETPVYLFIFQCKEPPFEVRARQLAPVDLEWGRLRNARALRLFAECRAADVWPRWDDDEIRRITMPDWAHRRLEAEHAAEAGAFDPFAPIQTAAE